MTCGLPHLKRRSEFVRVSRSGRSKASAGMVVQARRRESNSVVGDGALSVVGDDALRDDGQIMRLGITASKKVGNAVARSRAKRLLREALRAVESRLTNRGIWIVVVARKNILTCKAPEVLDDLEDVMMGEGLVRKKLGNYNDIR